MLAQSIYQATAPINGYEFSRGGDYDLFEYESVAPGVVFSGQTERHHNLIVGGGLTGLR